MDVWTFCLLKLVCVCCLCVFVLWVFTLYGLGVDWRLLVTWFAGGLPAVVCSVFGCWAWLFMFCIWLTLWLLGLFGYLFWFGYGVMVLDYLWMVVVYICSFIVLVDYALLVCFGFVIVWLVCAVLVGLRRLTGLFAYVAVLPQSFWLLMIVLTSAGGLLVLACSFVLDGLSAIYVWLRLALISRVCLCVDIWCLSCIVFRLLLAAVCFVSLVCFSFV